MFANFLIGIGLLFTAATVVVGFRQWRGLRKSTSELIPAEVKASPLFKKAQSEHSRRALLVLGLLVLFIWIVWTIVLLVYSNMGMAVVVPILLGFVLAVAAAGVLVATTGMVTQLWGYLRAGQVIVDLGPDERLIHNKKRSLDALLPAAVIPAVFLVIEIFRGGQPVGIGALQVFVTLVLIGALFQPVHPLVTEQGIFDGLRLAKWDRIQQLEWSADGTYVIFVFRRWIPIFNFGWMPVHPEQREEVEQVLQRAGAAKR